MKTKLAVIRFASLATSALASLSFGSLFLASRASAQPLSASSQTAVAQAAPTGASAAAASDPNIDRAFLQPTAMTQPAGTITYNNYELILHGVTYGVTDNVQTTLTVLSPLSSDMPLLGFGAVKWRLLATSRFHLALQGSLGFAHQSSGTDASVYTMGAGAFASFCLRDDCSSLLSATVNYQLAANASSSSDRAHVIIYGGSLVHRVGRHVKLLGEVTSAAVGASTFGGGETNFENLSGVLVSYGLRFHTGDIAGDVGFIKPFVDEGDGGLLMGLPFINFSYRWQ
jgi:hypothetical protein